MSIKSMRSALMSATEENVTKADHNHCPISKIVSMLQMLCSHDKNMRRSECKASPKKEQKRKVNNMKLLNKLTAFHAPSMQRASRP